MTAEQKQMAKVQAGRVAWVKINIDRTTEDFDHLITSEERLRVVMARQQSTTRAPSPWRR